MSQDLREYVEHLPIIDVHEHHLPEIYLGRRVGLLDLFRQSYAEWTRARPYPLPGETRDGDPMLAPAGPCEWKDLAPYLERSGSSSFVRNLCRALADLYQLGPAGVTRDNFRQLDEEVRNRHADARWPGEVLRRARVTHVITDPYTDPLLDARAAFGRDYSSVLRINALAVGWHPDSKDHNGNRLSDIAARLGCSVDRFEDLEELFVRLVSTLRDRHQVALKNALAYDRDLHFDAPDLALARAAWGKVSPTAAERKAFGDWVVDRLCAIAGEHDVPVQTHAGTALIRGSHPLHLAGLIERHPRTRFLLMHLAYPWSSELLGMAFVYRNVWIDLTWSFLLSPTHFRRAFDEAIEILPDETRMMLGGDNWHAEETYGTLALARRLIGAALDDKVRAGWFDAESARRLARRIFTENAAAFFGIAGVG